MKSVKKIVIVLTALLVLGAFLYGQNLLIDINPVEISSPRLPEGFEDFTLLQLSDLHGREFGQENGALLAAVRRAAPDIICITGDLFDEHTELSMLSPLLKGLCALAPTYYVTGNHEWQVEELKEILEEMKALGVHVLGNQWEYLEAGSEKIVIAGVHDPWGPADQKSPGELMGEIRRAAGDAFVLMLCHRNDSLDTWADLEADLVLAGHCHGGVVRLPYIGGLVGPGREFLPDFDAGLYQKGSTFLYVSRGLGYSGPPFRLFNPPELPLLRLKT